MNKNKNKSKPPLPLVNENNFVETSIVNTNNINNHLYESV
jgi:hypothetical protein